MNAAKVIQVELNENQQEPKLVVRIGMHTGDVIRAEDDLFGTVINKAARVASAANPGQISIADGARAMVANDEGFLFESPVGVMLRGLEGNHSISTLNWP